MTEMVINNKTFEQWAKELFEFENCSECGKDEQHHYGVEGYI